MSRNFSALLQKPTEHWRGGLPSFLDLLRQRGFEPVVFDGLSEAAGDAKSERDATWESLENPTSFESGWTPTSYAYVAKLPAKSELELQRGRRAGLLLVDARQREALLTMLREFNVDASVVISCRHPDAAMDLLLRELYRGAWVAPAGNATQFSRLATGLQVESHVVIGPEVEIGEGTILETGVRIGARVKIGKHCRLGAHTVVADDSIIGDGCQIAASVAIGGQGFGFVQYPGEKERRPRLHVGRAVLGSHLRIGSFCAIDRGVIGDTTLRSYSALDNFVQVAHNCQVGERAILCGFVGISGSTLIGNDVTIAGMVGTKGHVTIGDRVTIAAQSGISRDIPSDQTVKGYPPLPLPEALKVQSLLARLPELFDRLRTLEKSKA